MHININYMTIRVQTQIAIYASKFLRVHTERFYATQEVTVSIYIKNLSYYPKERVCDSLLII